ncbi:hypothetical protein A2602_04620 [candidate division WWE3 bacterium RIFOXYD1_FULL_40_11]|nr:MAG: hypothetical protein A2602_04620 [candidate division WWE3 bacterium RIFOXYD1_FULL_40_11]
MVIKSRFFVRIIQVTLLLVLVGCIPLDTSDYENAWSEEEAIIFDRLPDGGFFPPGTLPCTGETIEGTNVGVVGFQNGYTREYLFHFFDRVVKKDAAYFKNARALDNCVVESAAGLRLKVNPPSQQALVIAGADIPVESFSRRYFLEPDRECRGTLVNGSEVAVYGYSKQSRVFIYKTAEQGNQEGDPRSFSSWQQLVSCLNEGGLPVEIKYVYLPDSSTTLSRREYDTEEEARRYAESQYEAGAVFLQRGFDTPILLEILDAWAPPDELAGWPSGERYFQLSTSKGIKWHRYLEGAIAEANRTPEAVTVKSFKRGKEQKIELEYPNFVPPTIEVRPGVFKEITIVEVYYTVGEYVSQNLN